MAVMGVRRGTNLGRLEANSESSFSSRNQSLTKEELDRLGVEDVGELANRISNPNFTKMKAVRGVGNNKLDKDAFMKIMLTQMKNQDPTNPLKSHEMAAQLAQFSGLEQLQNVNSNLEELKSAFQPSQQLGLLQLIGKTVRGDSTFIHRMKGDRDHVVSFKIPQEADLINIKILNERGEVIREKKLSKLNAGNHEWIWDGRNGADEVTPAGKYRVKIEAKASNGNKLQVKTDFEGKVTGVHLASDGPVLLVGKQTVRLKDIQRIEDRELPVHKNYGQKVKTGLEETQHAQNNEFEGAPESLPEKQTEIMESVGMAKGLMNRLEKEVQGDQRERR